MEKVSLVIPVKNEGGNIQGLINSILNQALLPDEAVFVDGGSGDNTKAVIKSNMNNINLPIKLVETEGAYPGEGRNIGIKSSSFNLIALTDAGIELDGNWLLELMRPMAGDDSIDVVYGAYEPRIDSFLKECGLIAFVPPKETVNGIAFRTNFVASSLFKKKIFGLAGWFPPFRAAEDRIFTENVRKLGVKVAYTDKAKILWDIPGDIRGIFKRFYDFSFHDIVAGRAKDWHYSVFRTYAIALVFLFLSIFVNPVFIFGVIALFAFRLGYLYFKKRADILPKYLADIRYISGALFVLLVTDLALFCGTIKYIGAYHGKQK